jgi:hypothetical protein
MPNKFLTMARFAKGRGDFFLNTPPGTTEFIAHIVSEHGRACGWIRDNGRDILAVRGARSTKRLHLDPDCHKLSFSGVILEQTELTLLLEVNTNASRTSH